MHDSTLFGAPRPRSGVLRAEKILDSLYGADTLTSAFAIVALLCRTTVSVRPLPIRMSAGMSVSRASTTWVETLPHFR